MKKLVLVTLLLIATSSFFAGCTYETTYKCAQCGKTFTTNPYTCIMYQCKQDNSYEKGGLETFCSCECGIKYRAKEGFNYTCK